MAVNKARIQETRVEIMDALANLVLAQGHIATAGDVQMYGDDEQIIDAPGPVATSRDKLNKNVSSLQWRLKELEELL